MQNEELPRGGGADDINGLCRKHNMSRTKYYDLDKKGLGPKYFFIGNQRRFSEEAQAAWRRKLEELTESGQLATE